MSTAEEARAAKRPKRTYRACYPCRSRKLKCSFGDPNMPWDGPCERCLREQRECLRAKATFVREAPPRKTDVPSPPETSAAAAATAPPSNLRPPPPRPVPPHPHAPPTIPHPHAHSVHRGSHGSLDGRPGVPGQQRRSFSEAFGDGDPAASDPDPQGLRDDKRASDDSDDEDDDGANAGDDILVTSNLQNPSDALKLLASASSLQYHGIGDVPHAKARELREAVAAGKSTAARRGNNAATWLSWPPIQQGYLSVQDARALFSFYELEMGPLYPLIHPMLFEPQYLETLVKQESLLLGTILVIAARYSKILADNRGAQVHSKLSQWVRLKLLGVMDGDTSLRNISTVEVLLLLSEWPMLPMSIDSVDEGQANEEARLLKPSVRYDAYSWTNIGWAIRLAQELGLHDAVNLSRSTSGEGRGWKQHRMLKTWVYAYNAERHIAVRLGRNAVLQEPMTTQWWEAVSDLVGADGRGPGTNDVHTSDVFILSCIAQLMGTIQDHLYPHKEVTRALLRTGAWEPFLRSFRLEIRYSKRSCQYKLSDGSVDSALLQIELDYVVLYANSLALRALQGKLRRRRQANDVHYLNPSLLNMVEGPWIMEALSAARSIIEITLNVLEARRILRYCPSRIFQYILFATTFLYKALAAGMVEYGEHSIVGMVQSVVSALSRAAIDDQHFLYGFADLLQRLGKHWRSASATSPSVLNRAPNKGQLPPAGEDARGDPAEETALPDSQHPAPPNMTPAPRLDQSLLAAGFGFDFSGAHPGAGAGAGARPSGAGGSVGAAGAGTAPPPPPPTATSGPSTTTATPSNLPPGPNPNASTGQTANGGGLHVSAHAGMPPLPGPPGGTTTAAALGLPDPLYGGSDDFNWNFDPTFQMPAAANEQDMLFQSIWDNTEAMGGMGGTANLYATLLGDVLNCMEGAEPV